MEDPLTILLVFFDANMNCVNEPKTDLDKFSIQLTEVATGKIYNEQFQFTDKVNVPNQLVSCSSYVEAYTPSITHATTAGNYIVSFNIGNYLVSNKLKIVTNNVISPEKSLIISNDALVSSLIISAGDLVLLKFIFKDKYDNDIPINAIDNTLAVQIKDLKESTDYSFEILPNKSDKQAILKIFKAGTFLTTFTYGDINLSDANGLKTLTVLAGICSDKFTQMTLKDISVVEGSYTQVIVKCFDMFGNEVKSQGNEQFKLSLTGTNLPVINNEKIDYNLKYINNGEYKAEILIGFPGNYQVQLYFNNIAFKDPEILTGSKLRCTTDKPIMCSDKTCVSKISECSSDISADCPTDKPLKCTVNNIKTCVSSLAGCDCSSSMVKINGMCYPYIYSQLFKEMIDSNYCKIKFPNNQQIITCFDGSCRNSEDSCPSNYSCPLNFKSCGPECIPKSNICLIPPSRCPVDQVTCWDLSCTKNKKDCPSAKTCKNKSDIVCPDGSCASVAELCTQPPLCNGINSYLCPDFTCRASINDCFPKKICKLGETLCENNKCSQTCDTNIQTCTQDKVLCQTGQCVLNIMLCPTPLNCPNNAIRCSNGNCANSEDECNFIDNNDYTSCSLDTPILCPDLTCKTSLNECSNPVSCPNDLPYKCADGVCKYEKNQCSTKIECPSDTPVLCSDNTCQKASYHCINNDADCSGIRCSDGSCAASITLCPTDTTCPTNTIKCWNGGCALNQNECRNLNYSSCPSNLPFRCNDSICRTNFESCPTTSICPIDKPIKCYDKSCKESLNLCPIFTSCNQNMISCPDGTCSSSKCSSPVTCHSSKPFLCFDNTCVEAIKDCPKNPECSGVICPDGSCVPNRMNCKYLEPCSANYPIRCSNGFCTDNVDECYANDDNCPLSYTKCSDGSCRLDSAYCEPQLCPPNLPVLCNEGKCVADKNYCNKENGCPYNLPFKCTDGSCSKFESECLNKNTMITCPNNYKVCPDGSCVNNNQSCPLINGCSLAKPQKCADGTCIDPEMEICNLAICSGSTPILCNTGECVTTSSSCPSNIRQDDYTDCTKLGFDKLFMCADGRCVPSPDHCIPLFTCDNEFYKCGDNSCRISSSLCPQGNNCNVVRPFRLETGKCVSSKDLLNSNSLCPLDHPYKCPNGVCSINSASCPIDNKIYNGCQELKNLIFDAFYKCPDGRCLQNADQCKNVNIACTIETPYLCDDGTCVIDINSCSKTVVGCGLGKRLCPSGLCVSESDYNILCTNIKGCPLNKPFRCADGTCGTSFNDCDMTIRCPSDKPILCGDFTCTTNLNLCKTLMPCPLLTSNICSNGLCTLDNAKCSNFSNLCPLSTPIRCESGKCVDSILFCSKEYLEYYCRPDELYCKSLSKCVSSNSECIDSAYIKGSTNVNNLRNMEEVIKVSEDNNNQQVENGCNTLTPFSCYDGTCRTVREECPILPACPVGYYRCGNGACALNLSQCKDADVKCSQGLIKCEDGLCRVSCPKYDGCSLATPYQCSNGACSINESECIGKSQCPDANFPFRCIDGTCVNSLYTCPEVLKNYQAKTVYATVNKYDSIKVIFALDKNKKIIGELYIPANSIKLNPITESYSQLTIAPYPHSVLTDIAIYNNTEYTMFDIGNGIIGSEGDLNLYNSVLSPIISINIKDAENNFEFPASLKLHSSTYLGDWFKNTDYCLAKLDNNKWLCTSRKTTEDQSLFPITSLGVYAVILNPERSYEYVTLSTYKSILFDNIKIVAIILGVIIFITVVLFYVFSRIVRYRGKYIDNKEKMINLQNQLEDSRNTVADVPGQTLGDNLLGIVFTKNPALSHVPSKKGMNHELENEIDDLQRKCKVLESQNRTIENKIQEVNDEYKMIKKEVDNLKNNNN